MCIRAISWLIRTDFGYLCGFPTVAGGDSIDWKNITPAKMAERIRAKTFPGAIVLFHLGKENTVQALPEIIRDLQAAHYEFCTVEELLLEGETYIDANGKQRKAN